LIRPTPKLLEWALALGLGAVFVYASLDKILEPAAFGPSRELGPLPANLLAVTLPWVELLTGLLLASGFWRREAAALAALMLLMFVAAVGAALWRGIDIENCGCFSVSGKGRRAGASLLVADVALLAAAVQLARTRPTALTTPGGAA
jgi:uncharacterized membrane protein YphA (DoxX/SURF4 family)